VSAIEWARQTAGSSNDFFLSTGFFIVAFRRETNEVRGATLFYICHVISASGIALQLLYFHQSISAIARLHLWDFILSFLMPDDCQKH
jgi:hypothetical protein